MLSKHYSDMGTLGPWKSEEKALAASMPAPTVEVKGVKGSNPTIEKISLNNH